MLIRPVPAAATANGVSKMTSSENDKKLSGEEAFSNDWRWQIREAIRSTAEFAEKFPERASKIAELPDAAKLAETRFPTLVTPYYASLTSADGGLLEDPVFKQVFPAAAELDESESRGLDPLAEERDSPLPRLVHRYPDRVLLLATNVCAVHCRFCLRKRCWSEGRPDSVVTAAELDGIVAYLAERPGIREVLISGGDPLLLETAKLAEILSRISRIPSVDIIRVGTRTPVALPMRVDAELAELLASMRGLWIATHFNHPVELTDASLQACAMLVARGVPILNQTVLLKGVNDSVEVLAELFAKLASNRIKPHYLFHLDPVAGTTHFATGVAEGVEIMRKLRSRISSVATPTFAIDLPGGAGKVPITPDYKRDGKYEGINGEFVEYYLD
jgi:lysine 2,3-aminomutase